MNAARRKQIAEIASQLETLKGDIENIKDDEQAYFDNMPESLQGGEKGTAAESAVEALDEAVNDIDSVLSSLEKAGE